MIRKYYVIVTILMVVSACHHRPEVAKPRAEGTAAMGVAPALKVLHFDYNKDPACGMPLHAGLQDSTVYNGKLYGFCSKECKDAFLKDPASYIAQIK